MDEIRASKLPLRYCMKCNKELNWSEGEESTCKDCWDTPQQQVSVEPEVKHAKNVKDYEWLNNKLDDILGEFEHKHTTKEGAKDKLFEFIFEDLVNEIQKLKDSSLSV